MGGGPAYCCTERPLGLQARFLRKEGSTHSIHQRKWHAVRAHERGSIITDDRHGAETKGQEKGGAGGPAAPRQRALWRMGQKATLERSTEESGPTFHLVRGGSRGGTPRVANNNVSHAFQDGAHRHGSGEPAKMSSVQVGGGR